MTTQTSTTPRRINFSLRWKLLIGFTLVFSAVFAAAYYWFYTFSTQMALGRIEEDMVDTLHAAVAGVDGDEFEALATQGVADEAGVPSADERYQRHQAWMDTIHKIEPRAVPYTYIKGPGANEILWVGDIYRIISPNEATKFLEPYESIGPLLQGLQAETLKVDSPYQDDWGGWVSAYAPIQNSRGENVGGFGIDFEAAYVQQVQDNIKNSVAFAFAITYGVLFVAVLILSNVLTQPIITLTGAAERIGEGDYQQNLSGLGAGLFADEIGALAHVFTIMVDKVYQREQSLRKQVEDLRIEIDDVKRQTQVSEIVDTDFFRDLQAKARTMRERRRARSGSGGEPQPEESSGQA
jgi:HAMP domain-containing protein